MANWNYMNFWSNNNEKFYEIMKDFDPKVSVIERKWDTTCNGTMHFTVLEIPSHDVAELSEQHPEMTFWTSIAFECERWNTSYFHEHKAGITKFLKVEPNYSWPYWLDDCPEEVFEALQRKLMEMFECLDRVIVESDEHRIEFDFNTVTLEAEHGEYKMKATKYGSDVSDVHVFKKNGLTWEPCAKKHGLYDKLKSLGFCVDGDDERQDVLDHQVLER